MNSRKKCNYQWTEITTEGSKDIRIYNFCFKCGESEEIKIILKEKPKESYQMTKEEYLNKTDNFPELPERAKLGSVLCGFDEIVGNWHKKFVENAIKEGKQIPENVLQDYPEFKNIRKEK